MSLRRKVVTGSMWNIIGTIARQGIRLISMVVVARLLTPKDFAIAGLSIAATQMIILLGGFGFGEALIARKNITEESCHSVFWAMAFIKIILAGMVCALAPFLTRFYHNPELFKPIVFIGMGLVISIGGVVPANLLFRKMRFFEINVVSFVASILYAGLGIFLAVKGFGYWALLIPVVAMRPLETVLNAILARYRPKFKFSWKEIRSMANFGFSILGTRITKFFADNGDYLILGRFLPVPVFGFYYFGYEKARLTNDIMEPQLENALFPAFRKMQDDLVRLRDKCLEATQVICWLLYPIHILMITLANPLVPIIFGRQWVPAVLVFQLFSAYAFINYLWGSSSLAMLVLNKPHIMFIFEVVKLSILLPVLLVLALRGASIYQIATVLLVIYLILGCGMTIYIYRRLKISFVMFIRYFWTLCIASGVMAISIVLIRIYLRRIGCEINIFIGILIGLVSTCIYFLSLATIDINFLGKTKEIFILIKESFSKKE